MSGMNYRIPVWWGRHDLPEGETRSWRLGGMDLSVSHLAQEWSFQQALRPEEQHEDNQQWRQLDGNPLPPTAAASRFFFSKTGDVLYLLPRLADRSVVAKPVNPLFIPSGQSITLYVSTPVWLGCYAEHFDQPLLDLPISRPSDTWFGRDTIRGEICYSTRVTGRTELSQVAARPFRVITPIHLHNSAADTMALERINVPMPFLPVYGAEDGRLWTTPLSVHREAGGRTPRIHMDPQISPEAGTVEMLSPPRLQSSERAIIRIFDNLFD